MSKGKMADARRRKKALVLNARRRAFARLSALIAGRTIIVLPSSVHGYSRTRLEKAGT